MWPFTRKVVATALPLSHVIQTNDIEDKLDFIIARNEHLTVAFDALSVAVTQATTDITNLIAAHAAGTPDTSLVPLTVALQNASAAIAAVLAPPVVAPAA